jgi:hypothetical protein
VTEQDSGEARIQRLLAKLDKDESNRLIGDDNVEYRVISEAAMAWQSMLFVGLKGHGLQEGEGTLKLLASSMVVLGTIIQWAYALGIRRGKASMRVRVRAH